MSFRRDELGQRDTLDLTIISLLRTSFAKALRESASASTPMRSRTWYLLWRDLVVRRSSSRAWEYLAVESFGVSSHFFTHSHFESELKAQIQMSISWTGLLISVPTNGLATLGLRKVSNPILEQRDQSRARRYELRAAIRVRVPILIRHLLPEPEPLTDVRPAPRLWSQCTWPL